MAATDARGAKPGGKLDKELAGKPGESVRPGGRVRGASSAEEERSSCWQATTAAANSAAPSCFFVFFLWAAVLMASDAMWGSAAFLLIASSTALVKACWAFLWGGTYGTAVLLGMPSFFSSSFLASLRHGGVLTAA
jgi:hypothetical protein